MTQPLGGWMAERGAVGALGYGICLALVGYLEVVQYRLKAREGRAWWASNGRDVLNLVALGVVSIGLWFQGFHGPLLVCIGGTLVLLLSLSQMRLEATPRSRVWSMLSALVLGLPALLWPAGVARAFQETLAVLIP